MPKWIVICGLVWLKGNRTITTFVQHWQILIRCCCFFPCMYVCFRSTQIKTYSWDNTQVILVGNKCDMEEERIVSVDNGKLLADQLGEKNSSDHCAVG